MSYGSPLPPAPAELPPSPAGPGVHPMTIGRVFELSLRMFRFRFRALAGAAAVLLVPLYVAQAVVLIVTAPVINPWFAAWERWFEEWQMEMLEVEPGGALPALSPPPPFPAGFVEAVAISVVVGIVAVFVTFIAAAAVIHAAGRTYTGGEPAVRESVVKALRRAPSLIGAQLLIYVAVLAVAILGGGIAVLLIGQGAGLLAFVGVLLAVVTFVAFVIMMIRWAFVAQAIMLDEQGALSALGRTWRLVGGSALRVLGYAIVLGLTVGLLSGVVLLAGSLIITGGQPATDAPAIIGEAVLAGAVSLLVTPYTTIFFTMLYYDIRWRKGEFAPATAQPQPYGGQYGGQPPYGGGQPPYGGGQPPYGGQPPSD